MSSSSQVGESWISSFCSLLGHEYFAEVSEDFIEDDFNLTGLQSQVPMYKEALEMILDVEPEDDEDEEEEEDEDEDEDDLLVDDKPTGYRRAGDRRHLRMGSEISMIESSAELLYGLIHQRYITSRPGIQQMAEKYEMQHFGLCPRVHCSGAKVLPVGLSDTPGQDTVKLFCPSCLDVYTPPNSRFQTVDGAFFGTTFGSLFFMTFPELDIGTPRSAQNDIVMNVGSAQDAQLVTDRNGKSRSSSRVEPQLINGVAPHNLAPGLGEGSIYEPRIYGFRVSERARSGPRMQWLRSKPNDINELDEMRRYWEEIDAAEESLEGDEEEDVEDEDENMLDADAASSRRKKNGTRKRAGRASPMDTNGVGEGG